MIRVLVVDDQALVRSGFRIILESEPGIEVVGEAANGREAVALAARLRPDVICMDVEMPELDGIAAARQILEAGPDGGAAPAGAAGASDGAGNADVAGNADGAGTPAAAPAILILTTFGHERYLFDALAAGVSGFLLKTSRAEQLIDAVRELAAGHALLGPDVTRAVLARVADDRGGSGGVAGAGTSAAEGAGAGAGAGSAVPGETPKPGAGPDPFEQAGLTEREREVLGLLAQGASNAEIAAALFLGEATIKTHVSNVLQKLGVRDRIQAVVWAHTRGAG
ncbi:response regulator [Leucobacter luti]|uniref:LuxR family two component transcriptional regulator n=1 Tax=Leucobacter luti TaxID=340320 RepID=A0A4Q7U301_9MICO|nr:response regulator transcription factor [Leucobacter luti]MBL3699299.1 DNA-binding response regulator [Leucobacter luti]RZT66808.1 LuxR family two component transcriptional regulator [Leucobacter luti]